MQSSGRSSAVVASRDLVERGALKVEVLLVGRDPCIPDQHRNFVANIVAKRWLFATEFCNSKTSGVFLAAAAAIGSCDLSVLHVGGEWQWLVRQAGRDVAEGAARAAVDAKKEAEKVARKLVVCPPNTDVTVSAIYKCHWGRAMGGRGAPA